MSEIINKQDNNSLVSAKKSPILTRGGGGLVTSKRMLKVAVAIFAIIYTLITIFPFYVLFIRTFVSTRDSTDLHLWIPQSETISMNAQVGNLAVYYDLDLRQMKEDMGIPVTDFLPQWMTLQDLSETYNISEAEIKDYFSPYSVFNGWIVLVKEGAIWPAMLRSVMITLLGIVGLIFLSLMTGFALRGLYRRDQMFWYGLYILRMIIPPMLIILPQFLIMQWILSLIPGYNEAGPTRYISQMLALVILYVKGGAVPTLLFTSAVSALPQELEEAAEIDGANPIQYFFHIVIPLMKVPIASLVVIYLPFIWNDFLQPYVYLDPANTTLLPLIQGYSGQYSTNFQVTFTAVFLSVMPLVLIYVLFRRWFVSGALAGAIKG